MVRRSGLDDVIAPWQFERLFETAARIKDLELAVEMAYLFYTPYRLGPRNSEALHVSDDYYVHNAAGKIVSYQIPTAAPDCKCNVCYGLARQRARSDDDPDATAEDYIDEYWTPKSHAAGRKIPVLQERGREILELYGVKHLDKPNMTGETFRNRLARLEELCDAVDVNVLPQGGRATCANYWALWGLDAKYIRHLMGWKYISTAQYYIEKSDVHLRSAMQNAMGRRPTIPYDIYNEPPTFLDLRPDDPDDMIEVDRLTPKQALPSESSPADEGTDPLEEHAQKKREHMTLDHFLGDDPEVLTVTPMGAAVSLAAQGGSDVERRARREKRAMEHDPEAATPTAQHAASFLLACGLLATMLTTAFATGSGGPATAALLLAGVKGVWDIDLEEPKDE